jgi:hypothetical protein
VLITRARPVNVLAAFQTTDALIVKFCDVQEPRGSGSDVVHQIRQFADILCEHFHALRQGFVPFRQFVDTFINRHAAILYAALRTVKNSICSSFFWLHSAAYSCPELRGTNETMAPKNAAAVALGRRGGKATAQNRTAEQRSDSARKAVEARWAKLKRITTEIDEGTKALLNKNTAYMRRMKKR